MALVKKTISGPKIVSRSLLGQAKTLSHLLNALSIPMLWSEMYVQTNLLVTQVSYTPLSLAWRLVNYRSSLSPLQGIRDILYFYVFTVEKVEKSETSLWSSPCSDGYYAYAHSNYSFHVNI